MGWLIDLEERSLIIYPSEQQPELLQELEDIIPAPDFVTDLQLTVGNVFGWLKL